MPETKERAEERKHSLVAPAPPGVVGFSPAQGTPNPNRERLGRIYGVQETWAACTQLAACPWLKRQLGESRREILAHKTVGVTCRLWPALTEKNFLYFGEVECMEIQGVAQSVSVGATEGLF